MVITDSKRKNTKAVATIGIIVTAMMMIIIIAVPSTTTTTTTILQPALAARQKYELITGSGTGTLSCNNQTFYPNTSIDFRAIVPVVKSSSSGQTGPAQDGSSMTLTNAQGVQTQGTITAGGWQPTKSPNKTDGTSYTLLGTTTTDGICGLAGSPFTISGIIGPQVRIFLNSGGIYQMIATGSVTAQGWTPTK
jgi:hypothetical protein